MIIINRVYPIDSGLTAKKKKGVICMKKKVIAGAVVVLLMCALGVAQALAAGAAPAAGESAPPGWPAFVENGEMPGGRHGAMFGWNPDMTDEEKAEMEAGMEAAMVQREEKLKAFIESLNDEQKVAFNELFGEKGCMFGAMEGEGSGFAGKPQFRQRGEGGWDKPGAPGAPGGMRWELSEEEMAQMEAALLQQQEKLTAFMQTLNEEQKALYEAMAPKMIKPSEGQPPMMLDEAAITAIKEASEAFLASLTEEQKALYEEIMGGRFHIFRLPDETGADAGTADARLQQNMNRGRGMNFGAGEYSINI